MARILDQICGHQSNIGYLLAAVAQGRLSSTLIFAGPSGVGKHMVARGVIQALLCLVDSRACGQCPTCVRVEKGESESVKVVTGANHLIRIEASREILRFLSLTRIGSAQVIIIDEAQTMNAQAANALLKVLEEPPPRTYFFLIVPSLAGLLPTIRSRAQVVRFSPLSVDILKELRPGLKEWVYRAGRGSLASLDLLASQEWTEWRNQALDLWVSLGTQERARAFGLIADIARDREVALFVVRCWQTFIRDIWVLRENGHSLLNLDFQTELRHWSHLSSESLRTITSQVWEMESLMLQNVDRQIVFESTWLTGQRQMREERSLVVSGS